MINTKSEIERKQVPQGYVRCDFFIVTHRIIIYDVIGGLLTSMNNNLSSSKIIWVYPTDRRTDETSYDAQSYQKRKVLNDEDDHE